LPSLIAIACPKDLSVAENFDRAHPKIYFSSKFLKNHIFVGSEGAKKQAERVFQRRGKPISTVLCLTKRELIQLAGEIHCNQELFSRSPKKTFTTQQAYDYWSRGGSQDKDKQRATLHTRRFDYNVQRVGEIYVMAHFDG
jgi:hypothetical protein